MSKIIILRGNSGSGKSTIARRLQAALGRRTMLIPQDILRREILGVKEGDANPSIQLIFQTAVYGLSIGYDVILEGILRRQYYGQMLQDLTDRFDEAHVYYFAVSLEETLRRHATKPNAGDFGEKEMRRWYKEHDALGPHDSLIHEELSEDEILNLILSKLSK